VSHDLVCAFAICVPDDSLRYYGQATKLSVAQVLATTSKRDGLFLISCLAHTGNVAAATSTTVQGTTFVPLVRLTIFRKRRLVIIMSWRQ
jgi:hypothetical protein